MFTLLAARNMEALRSTSQRRTSKPDEEQIVWDADQNMKKKSSKVSCWSWMRTCPSPSQWVVFCLVAAAVVMVMSSVTDSRVLQEHPNAGKQLAGEVVLSSEAQFGRKTAAVAGTQAVTVESEFSRLLKERSVNNQILVTISTITFKDVLLNMLCSLERIQLTNYIVGALDASIYKLLKDKGYPVIPAFQRSVLGGMELESAIKRRENFHKVNAVKEEVVLWALNEGYEVLQSDSDIVWNRNPMEDLAHNYRNFDYAFQIAVCEEDTGDCHLNNGLFYVKPTVPAKKAMQMVVDTLTEDYNRNDQNEVRYQLCMDSKRKTNTTCYDPESGANALLLSQTKYAKAALLKETDDDQQRALAAVNPFSVHYNGGTPEVKESNIREQGLWYLNDENICTTHELA